MPLALPQPACAWTGAASALDLGRAGLLGAVRLVRVVHDLVHGRAAHSGPPAPSIYSNFVPIVAMTHGGDRAARAAGLRKILGAAAVLAACRSDGWAGRPGRGRRRAERRIEGQAKGKARGRGLREVSSTARAPALRLPEPQA